MEGLTLKIVDMQQTINSMTSKATRASLQDQISKLQANLAKARSMLDQAGTAKKLTASQRSSFKADIRETQASLQAAQRVASAGVRAANYQIVIVRDNEEVPVTIGGETLAEETVRNLVGIHIHRSGMCWQKTDSDVQIERVLASCWPTPPEWPAEWIDYTLSISFWDDTQDEGEEKQQLRLKPSDGTLELECWEDREGPDEQSDCSVVGLKLHLEEVGDTRRRLISKRVLNRLARLQEETH